ncbi:MAG: glycosyltransferase family 2 protein [Planctomycetota bacterium]
MKTICICIVTYRAPELTIQCLKSLEPELASLPGSRVRLVENGSADGSLEKIAAAIKASGWSSWVDLIEAPGNRGFAFGNNVAIRAERACGRAADYLMLLNPDTVARPGAIRALFDFLESHPQIGIVGGRSEDPDGTPQHCCFRFPGLIDEFAQYLRLGLFDRVFAHWITRLPIRDEPHEVGWLSGASVMMRGSLVDQIGLMDEHYFLYFEETDFLLRATRAGWLIWHVPQSRIIHYVGQTTGVTKRGERLPRRPSYWFESRRRYFASNYGRAYAVLADLCAMAGVISWKLRTWLERKTDYDPPHLLGDYWRHSALWKSG